MRPIFVDIQLQNAQNRLLDRKMWATLISWPASSKRRRYAAFSASNSCSRACEARKSAAIACWTHLVSSSAASVFLKQENWWVIFERNFTSVFAASARPAPGGARFLGQPRPSRGRQCQTHRWCVSLLKWLMKRCAIFFITKYNIIYVIRKRPFFFGYFIDGEEGSLLGLLWLYYWR